MTDLAYLNTRICSMRGQLLPRPAIEEMLFNLQETTRNLKEFSRILADQPDALIRGKGTQGRTNGESE